MKPETIKQVVAIARTCGMYTETSVQRWIEHFVVLANEGHLQVVEEEGEVLGFMTWTRVVKPARVEVKRLPEDINKGDYVGIILLCVKQGIEGGARIIEDLKRQVAEVATDAKYWAWARAKYNHRVTVSLIRRRAA